MTFRKTFFIVVLTCLVAACARPRAPLELEAAEKAVGAAYRAGAARSAATEFEAARQALTDARMLVAEGCDQEARKLLLDAIEKGHQAELATYRRQLELTEDQLGAAEEYILRLEAQRNSYFEALSKIYDEQKLSEIKVTSPKPDYKPSPTYRVRRGENLFAIAARKNVYGDALLWPLIYKANRDQIKDPQQIYPGQVLSIPRDVSAAEKEEARAIARESKIFPQPPPNGGK